MNIEEIQEMWQRDSVIDPDNLHDETLKTTQLHAKYYTLHNTITLLRDCLLYTSPSPRDVEEYRMPSSA